MINTFWIEVIRHGNLFCSKRVCMFLDDKNVTYNAYLLCTVSTFPQDFRVITGLDFTMWTLAVAGSFTGMTVGLYFPRTGLVGILLEMSRTIPHLRDVFEFSMENGEQLNVMLRDDLFARHR